MCPGNRFWGTLGKVGAAGINRTVCGGQEASSLASWVYSSEDLSAVSPPLPRQVAAHGGGPESQPKRLPGPAFAGRYGVGQRRVEETGGKERAAG